MINLEMIAPEKDTRKINWVYSHIISQSSLSQLQVSPAGTLHPVHTALETTARTRSAGTRGTTSEIYPSSHETNKS